MRTPRSPLPPSRIPVARSRSCTSRVQPTSTLDAQGLVQFVLESATELRNITRELGRQARSNSLLPILSRYLSEVHARLDVTPPSEHRLFELLTVLERLASWPLSFETLTAPEGQYRTSYPRLDCLARQAVQSRRLTQACIKRFAEDSQPKAFDAREECLDTLKAFVNAEPLLLDIDYQPESIRVPQDDVTEYLRELYTSLQRLSFCADVDSEFRANAELGFMSRGCETEGLAVELFLLHRHSINHGANGEWREAHIDVCENRRHGALSGPRVGFASPTEEKLESSSYCTLLHSSTPGRLKLRASTGRLFHKGFDHLVNSGISLQAHSVPLSTILAQACVRYYPRNVVLPYLLSQAVYQFYDSDWMAEGWTADTVHFMWQCLGTSTRDPLLHHKPFVSVVLRNAVQQSKETDGGLVRTHRYPKVLALGVMLLEICLGHRLEVKYPPGSVGVPSRPHPNSEHITAIRVIQSSQWNKRTDIPSPVRKSIEFCLNPGHEDSRLIRERLYRQVVGRLKKLYKDMYNDATPPEGIDCGPIPWDAAISRFDTMPMEQTYQAPASFIHSPLESLPTTDLSFSDGPNRRQNLSRVISSTQQVMEELQLFCLEQDSSNHRQVAYTITVWGTGLTPERLRSHADEFMASLKDRCVKFGTGRQSRIKVCIIDTGIDMSHAHLRTHHANRIKERRAFNGGSEPADVSGHGTHIAGILLELAPNVDLYIAKFTESQKADLAPASVRRAVSEALHHARTSWEVDMISLSFGFRHTGGPDEVREEIDKCLNAGITVFASASNDSGHKPRTYPGNYDRVLCIHSTSGGGNKSPFNPTDAPPETKEDNFSTVGECVKSYWPAAADTMGDLSVFGHRYMSGTSFATPVAVAIAAFMVGYIEKKIPGYGWNVKPMSPEGIRKIFKLMSQVRDGYDWISPECYFSRFEEEKIKWDIIHELRGYPKGKSMEWEGDLRSRGSMVNQVNECNASC